MSRPNSSTRSSGSDRCWRPNRATATRRSTMAAHSLVRRPNCRPSGPNASVPKLNTQPPANQTTSEFGRRDAVGEGFDVKRLGGVAMILASSRAAYTRPKPSRRLARRQTRNCVISACAGVRHREMAGWASDGRPMQSDRRSRCVRPGFGPVSPEGHAPTRSGRACRGLTTFPREQPPMRSWITLRMLNRGRRTRPAHRTCRGEHPADR